jgi:predicted HicB family RNase H-like nuclease
MAKRILDGKTYNTETATLVWSQEIHPQDIAEVHPFNELYQNRFGAYFSYAGNYRDFDDAVITPLTPLEAEKWMEQFAHAHLIEKHFGEKPEAGDSETRFTLRMPDSLKRRIDEAAKLTNQSVNAWIVRCIEQHAPFGPT